MTQARQEDEVTPPPPHDLFHPHLSGIGAQLNSNNSRVRLEGADSAVNSSVTTQATSASSANQKKRERGWLIVHFHLYGNVSAM